MPAPKVGQVIHNKYRLLRHIGDGGMGSVYEARHETLGATVALKFLHLEFARREGLVQRFLQEARASARMQNPHVVRVSDVDQTPDGDVFIVLEYLEGRTLQALYEELYRAGKRLPYGDALDYAEQVLDGVEAAHRAGIVHRDLKPDNVMVTLDGKGATVLKLLDFGIAKLRVLGGGPESARGLTRPGVMMGTPEYMAPEQATSADAVDARADVFALGVMIFELLAGQRPVGGDNPLELSTAYRTGKISKLTELVPGVPPGLAAAVHRAMSADPRDRFATATELREAIAPFVSAAAAVRAPSPSRIRAGGTIGVPAGAAAAAALGVSSDSPKSVALAASGLVPPPTTEARPLGPPVAKTFPDAADHDLAPASGASGSSGSATVVDDSLSLASEAHRAVLGGLNGGHVGHIGSAGSGYAPDRTHRVSQPYAPPPPSVGPRLPVAIVNAPTSRAFADRATTPALRAPAPSPRKPRRGGGMPIGAVLGAAAAVALAVTGITYVASHGSSSSRDDDPIAVTSTGAPVGTSAPAMAPTPPGAPPVAEPPPAPPAPPASLASPVPGGGGPGGLSRSRVPRSRVAPTPGAPSPTGPVNPAVPAPSTDPTAPPPPPTFVIPSALPIPNPFDTE